MRLGLLGPAGGKTTELRSAARFLKDEIGAERVVYLGVDSALDTVVADLAHELVGPGVDDASLYGRATRVCLDASPEVILDFLARERQRESLRMFESLASETTRSVELIGGKVAVMLYDKALLVEDDILPATLLVFGKNREAMIKQVGRRWFVSPGVLPKAGIMVIEEQEGLLTATAYDAERRVLEARALEAPKTLRMRVTG